MGKPRSLRKVDDFDLEANMGVVDLRREADEEATRRCGPKDIGSCARGLVRCASSVLRRYWTKARILAWISFNDRPGRVPIIRAFRAFQSRLFS